MDKSVEDLCYLSAIDAVDLFKQKKLSPVEVLKAQIDRLKPSRSRGLTKGQECNLKYIEKGGKMLNRVSKIRLSAYALLISTSVSWFSVARAQSVPNSETTAQTSAVETGDGEIVVTAQKRAQSAQDVGITLTALSGDDLAKRGVQNVTDLVGVTSSVQVNVAAGMNSFNIRGMGSNDFSTNFGSPVSIHMDEVYISKVFIPPLLMFDIDRIEVLKGPQGTLFGRNTTGGSINLYTRQPTDTLSANASVGYGNYDMLRAEGGIGGPLTDTLSARISAMVVNQGKGFYRNLLINKRDGAERKYAVRGQLKWDSGSTTVLGSLHYGKDKSRNGGYEVVGVYTPQSVAAGAPQICPEYFAGTITAATPNCVLADGTNEGDTDPRTLNQAKYVHLQDNTSIGGLLRIEHDMGGSTLTSLTGYDYFRRRARESEGGTGIGAVWNSTDKTFSQELRLSSNNATFWNYVLGVYFASDTFESRDFLLTGFNTDPNTTSVNSGGVYSPFDQKQKSLAAFFHNEITVTDQLQLIAGVRWSREKTSIDGQTVVGSGIVPALPPAIVAKPGTVDAVLSDSSLLPDGGHRKDENVSFKVGVQWKPKLATDQIDDLMIYANISTGFRSGAYNAEFVTDQASFTSLVPETLTAYEAGFKSQWFNRALRLNGAVYRYDFSNGFINVDVPGVILPITSNAANIETYGAELEAQLRPFQGLTLSGALGWTDAKIKNAITSAGVSLRGNVPVNTAKWTYNVRAEYAHELSSDFSAFIAGDANYRSSQYLEASNDINSKQSGYTIVNAQFGIRSERGWSVTGWIKNLTDKNYRTYTNEAPALGFIVNIYGPPRTYGMTASVDF